MAMHGGVFRLNDRLTTATDHRPPTHSPRIIGQCDQMKRIQLTDIPGARSTRQHTHGYKSVWAGKVLENWIKTCDYSDRMIAPVLMHICT